VGAGPLAVVAGGAAYDAQMSTASTPARPASGHEGDRPLARVRSYARRGSRLTAGQQGAWEAHHERWLLPHEVATSRLDVAAHFGREAPLVVEIGSGNGESLAAMAAARPDHNVLALEVWRPGVASTFAHLERAGATNVRLLIADAETCLGTLCPEGSVAELWTFFPDPWPKQRHHKRRLVDPDFASTAAGTLRTDGVWRLATDWDAYAEQIERVLDAEPLLVGGRVARWEERPVTKFERRGLGADRSVTDLAYVRAEVADRR
jgi:tRNA (guanine-N7-)-methyltransferase